MRQTGQRGRLELHRALTLMDLLAVLFILGLLSAVLLPTLGQAQEASRRKVCVANQRGMGQCMHIYANDNVEWFPHHYYQQGGSGNDPSQHSVLWVGAMGSNDFLKVSETTTKDKSPTKSHPSRSLFLMIIQGMSTPKQFLCPESGDKEDGLRNYGPDAGGENSEKEIACQPGINRFDFQGYRYLSYGYQLPYGRKGKPRENLDVRMIVAADKGPYYEDAGEGLAGTKTSRDKRSGVAPPEAWADQSAEEILKLDNEKWRPYNSRNHKGEGQNVLFVDGHVEFVKKPIVGVNNDNIYTIQASKADFKAAYIGLMPAPDQAKGPLTETDSFIVP